MIKCGWIKVLTVPARDVTYLVQLFLSRCPGEAHGSGRSEIYCSAASRKLLEDPRAASERGKYSIHAKVSHGFRW